MSKIAEDADALHEMLRENGFGPRHANTKSPHEIGRITFAEGQIVVLFKTGTALIQGCGDKADLAALCRADGWKCKG